MHQYQTDTWIIVRNSVLTLYENNCCSIYQYGKGSLRFHSKMGRTMSEDTANSTVDIKNRLNRFENLMALPSNLKKGFAFNRMDFLIKWFALHVLLLFAVSRLERCRCEAFYKSVNTRNIDGEHDCFHCDRTEFGRHKEILWKILIAERKTATFNWMSLALMFRHLKIVNGKNVNQLKQWSQIQEHPSQCNRIDSIGYKFWMPVPEAKKFQA